MIEIEKISFSHGDKAILQGFSATLDIGEAVLMSGANGSGKTTTLQLIGGLLSPASGEIRIAGRPLSEISIKDQAMLRSVAPARRSFTLAFTVEQVLEFIPKKRRAAHTSRAIAALGLTELLNRKVTELSTGQQERVSLALALSQEASYYLLDEPFSGQDQFFTQAILELITGLKTTKGFLVISHNQEALAQYFDREIILAGF
jgi:biotin transport system ATP-binding protein